MFSNVLAFAANEQQWLESFQQGWKVATENGHLDLQSLVPQEDDESEYECGKLRTKHICKTDDMCAWFRKTVADSRGRFRMHCGLATEAPPKPEKKNKQKKNKTNNKKKMNKDKKKKQRAGADDEGKN